MIIYRMMLTMILCLFLNTSCSFILIKDNYYRMVNILLPNKNEIAKSKIPPEFFVKNKNYTDENAVIINPFKPRPIVPSCCLNFPPPDDDDDDDDDDVKKIIHEIIKNMHFFV